MIDDSGGVFRLSARNADLLRDGSAPTVHAVGSGEARIPLDEQHYAAVLRVVDVSVGSNQVIASVPTYPFRGALSVTVSPDRQTLALLPTLGAFQPQAGKTYPNSWSDGWTVERRLGFVDLAAGEAIRWVQLPPEARWPLQLYGWSPDSRHVAIRGRADPFSPEASLFAIRASDGRATKFTGEVAKIDVGVQPRPNSPVVWADERHLVARQRAAGQGGGRWRLLGLDGSAVELADPGRQPAGFVRANDGSLVTILGDRLLRLDVRRKALVTAGTVPGEAALVWPIDPGVPSDSLLTFTTEGGRTSIGLIDALSGSIGPAFTPSEQLHIANITDDGRLIVQRGGQQGIELRLHDLASGESRSLLTLNGDMADISLGETRVIDYRSRDGRPLKAGVILPPDYQPGRRYPTLSWVYYGYDVRGDGSDEPLAPFRPGFYNLQVYAARGYVVLVPSMPAPPPAERHDVYGQMLQTTMPAIDRLVELGIADPERLGVFGQSFGGYAVTALVTQTDRFKAAVSIAGMTDLELAFGQFDPTSTAYPGIGHEKSDNWRALAQFGRHALPGGDDGYRRNSPLSYAQKVTTPLLLIHGGADIRGAEAQSEQFFYALYSQGKTAKLLRYDGESHSLAQSPANIRHVFEQTVGWFDEYVRGE